ncbi:MAG: hypothetical protein ABF743_10165 [Schleiferilactobacillus perolens]|uniref:hypothetical protein n=1 Tax=Schleiferilactobacillus perolens TaxID=100468 RepID=UPI0039EA4780
MEKQIEELLRLLNQGVKHLPDNLNVLVQQFVLQKWVWAIFELIMMVAFAGGLVATLVSLYNLPKCDHDYDTIFGRDHDRALLRIIVGSVLGIAAFVFAAAATGNIAEAVSPVYSLIRALR